MKRFKLGDFVKYSNKGGKFDEKTGTIVCETYDDFIIKLDSPYKNWMVGTKDAHIGSSTFVGHEFNPVSFNYRRTISRDCIRIGKSSRNLKNAEIPYDPTQMGDRDDDI